MPTHKIKTLDTELTTIVISTNAELDQSLKDLLSTITRNIDNYKHVVALDIEKDYQPFDDVVTKNVAIVKLCFGKTCLIIRINYLQTPPCSLSKFLQLQDISFVGVGIKHCLDALEKDFGIKCRNFTDLSWLRNEDVEMLHVAKTYGLLDLVETVNGDSNVKIMIKDCSNAAVFSDWSARKLSDQQIEIAARGVFLCFCVGNYLFGGSFVVSFDRVKSAYPAAMVGF